MPGDVYSPDVDTLNLGLAEARLGNQAVAVLHYEEFLSLQPANVVAMYARANALWRLENTSEAMKGYRDAINVSQNFAEARNNLSMLLIASDRAVDGIALSQETADTSEADQYWAGAPAPWEVLDTLATGCLVQAIRLNDDVTYFRMAVDALNKALREPSLSPKRPGATTDSGARMYLRRGFALAKLGDLRAARSDIRKAQRYSRKYTAIRLTAIQYLSVLSPGAAPSFVSAQVAGTALALLGFSLLVLVAVQVTLKVIGDVAFATVAVASLGAMFLGASFPRLNSFKLGGAEAVLSSEVVSLTSFELPTIDPPS